MRENHSTYDKKCDLENALLYLRKAIGFFPCGMEELSEDLQWIIDSSEAELETMEEELAGAEG